MLETLARITILAGHAGVGKTNLALNLAYDLRARGEEVTLIDLDIVNPYFRSSDHLRQLQAAGIRMIAPQAAGSTLDLPALSGAVDGALDASRRVLIDAGGDDIGSTALGRFAPQLTAMGDYTMLYLINAYRISTRTPQAAAQILAEVEGSSRLKAAGLINNSHLSDGTTARTILDSLPFARGVAQLTHLPLICSTAPDFVPSEQLAGERIYPLRRLVRNPWE